MKSRYDKEAGPGDYLLKIDVKDVDGNKKYEFVIMCDGEEIILCIHNEKIMKVMKESKDKHWMEQLERLEDVSEENIVVKINHSQALKIASTLTGHVEEFMFDDMIEYTQKT